MTHGTSTYQSVLSWHTHTHTVGCPHEHDGWDRFYMREFHVSVRDLCIRYNGRFKRFRTFGPNFRISVLNFQKPTLILKDDAGNFQKERPVGETQRLLHDCVHYTPHTLKNTKHGHQRGDHNNPAWAAHQHSREIPAHRLSRCRRRRWRLDVTQPIASTRHHGDHS